MEKNEFISSGILELYVSGMASAEETDAVHAMCARYPEVKAELEAIELGMESYARAHAVEPGSHVRALVLGNIKNSSQTRGIAANEIAPAGIKTGPALLAPFWRYVAAASLLLLAGSLLLNYDFYNKNRTLSKEKNGIETQLLSQQRVNDEMKNDLQVVQSKYSEPVALHGLPAAPEAAAKIFWMKNTGEVYIDPSNLPEIPDGMQYQLWGIVDGKPVDGGLIIPARQNKQYRIQKMKSFGINIKVDAFAVTLETAGGNPVPKGDMYVMGKM